jgi:hypothetical protein
VSDTPSDSMKSRPRRHDARREPATIDLSATEVRTASPEPMTAAGETTPSARAEDVSAAAVDTTEGSGTSVRPTPDEVIPSDEPRPSSMDPDLVATPPKSRTSVPPSGPPESGPPESGPPESGPAESGPAGPSRRGFGFPSLLTAGVIGGLLGAGAAMLAEAWWRPRVSRVDARLAQMEERLAATPPPSLGPVETRMSRLEADNKALADRLSAAQALAERSAKDVQEVMKRPPAGQPGGAEAAASASVLADLATRLGAIEKQTQERAQAAAQVQERVTAMQEQTQVAASARQALERRIADQDQRLAALAKQLTERGPDAMAASLRVTLADRLADALQDGAPLGQILAMLRRLEVKPDTLRPLEPFAQSGPPTATALAQEFRPLGQRMIAESRPLSADWGERVWRMLDKVVTVRAVGDPQSTDVVSLVGRIEDALSRDAVAEAAAAWDALPERARAVAPEWGAKLKARAEAESAARKVYADALSGLEASTR